MQLIKPQKLKLRNSRSPPKRVKTFSHPQMKTERQNQEIPDEPLKLSPLAQ
jgi:hypothetical protein